MNAAQTPVSKAPNGRIPTLGQFPAVNSIQRARGPAPSRGPPQASSGLTPPPTITTKPQKPSRKVLLEPGHSPLDWASISGPNADLRGVPPETPYLKVTPSMLKEKTGRKGKDAWMAINGKVYNVSPYAKYHPGGVPELMRAAGRDGTKLFYEIHPWVNYDTMLAACLVGLMVEEPEGSGPSKMDEMD
ncbi:cytochrome b5 [Sarocladium strictum]